MLGYNLYWVGARSAPIRETGGPCASKERRMTNPFNRGTAPGRARDAPERPGTFKPGHKKLGGRKKGTPNALSADYKNAIMTAAYFVGRDGMGAEGLVGYCKRLLIECPDVGLMLMAQMFFYDD